MSRYGDAPAAGRLLDKEHGFYGIPFTTDRAVIERSGLMSKNKPSCRAAQLYHQLWRIQACCRESVKR